MSNKSFLKRRGVRYVYCRYVVRNGRKIYPKMAKVFRFPVAD